MGVGLALLAALFWWKPLWPMHDGPQHVLMAHTELHFDDPAQGYRLWFVEAPQFAGRGFALWYLPLEALLGPQRAAPLALFLVAAALALAGAVFFRAVHPERRWLALLAFPLAFCAPLYTGFLPYCVTTAAGLLLLAYTARRLRSASAPAVPPGGRAAAAHLAVFALFSTMHVASAAMCAGALGLWALVVAAAESPGERAPVTRARSMARALGWVLFVTAPVAVVAVLAARVRAQHPTGLSIAYAWHGPAATRLYELGKHFAPGPHWRGIAVLALALAGAVYRLAKWRTERPVDRALALASVAFVASAWLLPTHLRAWLMFSPRFLPLGIFCGLAALPLERLPRVARVAGPLAVAMALAWWPARFQVELRARLEDAWSGLALGRHRAGPRFFAPIDPLDGFDPGPWRREVVEWYPLSSLAELYAAVEGGVVVSTMFRGHAGVHAQLDAPGAENRWPPALEAMEYTRLLDGTATGPYARAALIDRHAVVGTYYEDTIVLGHRDAHEGFARRGYVFDFARGRLGLARYRGCTLALTVRGAGAGSLRVGWVPHEAYFHVLPLPAAAGPDGARTVTLERGPCGAIWLLPDHGTCAGAGANRRAVRMVDPTVEAPQAVECVIAAGE